MLKLVIGDHNYSSWSLRPWLVLKQSGLPFEEVSIRLRESRTKAEILKHSPSGKVPCLIDGQTVVWDSLAICEYIAEKVPAQRGGIGHAGGWAAGRGDAGRRWRDGIDS